MLTANITYCITLLEYVIESKVGAHVVQSVEYVVDVELCTASSLRMTVSRNGQMSLHGRELF